MSSGSRTSLPAEGYDVRSTTIEEKQQRHCEMRFGAQRVPPLELSNLGRRPRVKTFRRFLDIGNQGGWIAVGELFRDPHLRRWKSG
jgi:hypothetical protein